MKFEKNPTEIRVRVFLTVFDDRIRFFYVRKEYEMKILDKIILLASLPEMLKLAGSVIDRVFKFLGVEIGDEP